MKRFLAFAALFVLPAVATDLLWVRPTLLSDGTPVPPDAPLMYLVEHWSDAGTNSYYTPNETFSVTSYPGVTNYTRVSAQTIVPPSAPGEPSNLVTWLGAVTTVPPTASVVDLKHYAWGPQTANRWQWGIQWQTSSTNWIAFDITVAGKTTRTTAKSILLQGLTNGVPYVATVTAIDQWNNRSPVASIPAILSVGALEGGAVTYTLTTLPK